MSDEHKVLVCMGQPQLIGDVPTVIFGFTEAAWKQMEGGKTHTFDLRGAGVPCKVLMMRGESHAHLVAMLKESAASTDPSFEDHRRGKPLADLGIAEPTKQ